MRLWIPRNTSNNGQSIAEYGLIITLVGIVCILALTNVGEAVTVGLNSLSALLNGSPGSFSAVPGGTLPGSFNVVATPGSAQGLTDVTLTLGSGNTITLMDYPVDVGNTIETAGANGTTEKMAALLSSLTQQLLDQGEITPAQANLLQNLSNAGHDMAVIQNVAEEKILSCHRDAWYTPDCMVPLGSLPVSSTVTSESYDVMSLLRANAPIMIEGNNAAYGEGFPALEFKAYLAEVQSSGALNDPIVAEVVNCLAEQIKAMGNDLFNTSTTIFLGTEPNTTLNNQLVANKTHINSAGICGAGGTIDLGTHCPNN